LTNWVTYKKTQDASYTTQYLALQLIAGFSGLAFEWWRWLLTETKQDILRAEDADVQLLKALSTQFYGSEDHQDPEHLASLFMSQRLCDLSQHEKYLCDMQRLLIESGHADDPSYLKYYLRSFPRAIPDSVEQFFKDKQISLRGMSLAQLHAYIIQVWQEHFLEKRVSKYFKRFDLVFTTSFCKNLAKMPDYGCGAHNRDHQSGGCSCHKKHSKQHKYEVPSHFGSDRPHKKGKKYYKKYDKSHKKKSRRSYLQKRDSPARSEKCFICGKMGHWANQCPKKKKKPQLAAMFTDDFDPAWWDLASCNSDELPCGVVVFLPEDTCSDAETSSDASVDHAELGGCGISLPSHSDFDFDFDSDSKDYRSYHPPTFQFGMFSRTLLFLTLNVLLRLMLRWARLSPTNTKHEKHLEKRKGNFNKG